MRRRQLSEEEVSGIEAAIKINQLEVAYDVRDFTIDYLIQEYRADQFYIPPYQRNFIWNPPRQIKFIESVILGLPIPFLFFADVDDGRLEVVDGVQRLRSLEAFMVDDLRLSKLEKIPEINGLFFTDLPASQQRKFSYRALRVIVLEDKTSLATRHEIFTRINTGSVKATSSELWKGGYPGPFMDFLIKCASDPLFLNLCPISKTLLSREEGLELVVRFFAFSNKYKVFKHDVSLFLGAYIKDHQHEFDEHTMYDEFHRMLHMVHKFFPHGFSKSPGDKTTPRVRFEAISVGSNLALRENPKLVPGPIDWLKSDEFLRHTTTHASNSNPRLRGRVEYVRDQLLRGSKS